MLVNDSYKDRQIKEKIESVVGKTFNLSERWKLKGIGSPKLIIQSCSLDIHNLLVLDTNRNSCNIELRPLGVIIRFRSLLETFAWIIPYYRLHVYKGESQLYSIHAEGSFIKITWEIGQEKATRDFIEKIITLKNKGEKFSDF